MAHRLRRHLGITHRVKIKGSKQKAVSSGQQKNSVLPTAYCLLSSVSLWLIRITKFRNDMRAPSVNSFCDCEHLYIQTGTGVTRQNRSSDLCLYLLTPDFSAYRGLKLLNLSSFSRSSVKQSNLLSLVVTLFISLALSTPVSALQGKGEAKTAQTGAASPYRVGERLTYNVSFAHFASAAHVELLVARRGTFFGREGFELRAHVETLGEVSAALYALNNEYISYVDPASGMPFRTEQTPREHARDAAMTPDFRRSALTVGSPVEVTNAGASGMYDLLSGLYRARMLPLAQGSVQRLSISSGAEQYDAELKVTGREFIKTNVGSYNAIVTQVRTRGGSRAGDLRDIRIYFSDDAQRLPVLLTLRHPVGEIRIELASSEIVPEPSPPALAPSGNIAVVPPPAPPKLPVKNAAAPLPADLPFAVGEQLNYNLFLGGAPQPIGTASYQVRARTGYFGRDGLLLTATAQSSSIGQTILNVNDQISSYVNPMTLLPFRTELRLAHGRRRINHTITVDQDRGNVSTDSGQRIEIPVGTYDPIAVLYALRSFDLNPPKRNAVSLLLNNRPCTLFITSLKRETIELNNQRIPAVQLSLTTDDTQSDRYGLRLWVSADRRRLPLRMTGTTPLGTLRADLAIIPVIQQ